MPSAASRLADIEGPGLGNPLSADQIHAEIEALKAGFTELLGNYLTAVDAMPDQCLAAQETIADALNDAIADSTARQLREIEDGVCG
jgi:hypothetical protein